jgi:hypothetical protein
MSVVGESVARRAHALETRLGPDGRAWVVWAVFALVTVLARLDSVYSLENVFAIYREAGLRWLGGEDLYPAEFRFNYFPASAVLFAGWSWLPFQLGGALWRIANLAAFAFGVWTLSRCGEKSQSSTRFLIATVITAVLSASAARYGQMTLAMAGFMMVSVACAERGELWRAAFSVALAVALKPLAVVLALLMFVIYPRLSWRMAIALAAFFVLPFLFQHPDYVWRQYLAVPDMLLARAQPHYDWQQHIFGLLDKVGWTATGAQETIVRGASALLVLFLCWRVRKRAPAVGVELCIYALATCYILLLGGGTERNTYAMLAPVIGLLAATAWNTRDRRLLSLVSTVILIDLLSHTLQRAYPQTALAMVKPFACLILFAWLVWTVLRVPSDAKGVAAQPASAP